MPAPSDVIDAVAEEQAAEHEWFLDSVIATLQALWLVHGGPDIVSRLTWIEEAGPLLEAFAEEAARQGAAAASVIASLSLDMDLEDVLVDLTDPIYAETMSQLASHWDSPRIATAYHLSQGLSRDEAMQLGAARASKLGAGDVKRAYGAGYVDGARRRGGKVERYLKMPNPTACPWCFAVAARGYKSPESIPRHAHCKCGYRAVFVAESRPGSVRKVDWQNALEEAGYGDLIYAYTYSPQRQALVASRILEAVPETTTAPLVGV